MRGREGEVTRADAGWEGKGQGKGGEGRGEEGKRGREREEGRKRGGVIENDEDRV